MSWRLGDRSQNGFDGRNELPTKNTTTLKKVFENRLKNRLGIHYRSWYYRVSVKKKLLNLWIIIKTHKIYYRISYTKIQGLWKTPLFWGMWNVQTSSIDCETIFYRFWKTFSQSCCIFLESSFLLFITFWKRPSRHWAPG